MKHDYSDKAVVVTGGTKGIGLATGLAFGRAGATAYLTYAWGSAEESEVKDLFAEAGAPEPRLVEADASREDDTLPLLETIREEFDHVEAFVSNVTVVPTVNGIEDLTRRALYKSLEYSTWPLLGYLKQMKKLFGRYPKYVVGVSTDGVDNYYEHYDYVAMTKAVMESYCRYLAVHLGEEGCRVNAIRTRNVITESALALHGADYPEFVKKYASATHFIEPGEVGDAIFAICSGRFDALNGQVVSIDKGGPFSDSLMRLYRHREEYGI